jgi:hypothetical protein
VTNFAHNLGQDSSHSASSAADHFWSYDRVARSVARERPTLAPASSLLQSGREEMRRVSKFALEAMFTPRTASMGSAAGASRGRSGSGDGGDAPSGLVGSWQVWSLDWALDVSGGISLLEANAAPSIAEYSSVPRLTPALYTTMLELVTLAQTAPMSRLRQLTLFESPRSGFRYEGWELIHNDAVVASKPYNACAVRGLHSGSKWVRRSAVRGVR